MPWTSLHLKWLLKTGRKLTTEDGTNIELWEFCHKNDDKVLSAWAKHFRNHYCLDSDIDYLRTGLGHSRSQYLNNIKFPDKTTGFGPGTRAGDFGEILVADFLEYILKYWVPRTRYIDKTVRNESIKGCDIIGFKIIKKGEFSKEDSLAIFETKAQFSGNKPKSRLQEAIDDSIKDQVRKAESLNAIKQRLYERKRLEEAKDVERFQNPVDHPYEEVSGASALFETKLYEEESIVKSATMNHPNKKRLLLIVIYGKDMMNLVHDLYRRAADEA